MKTKKIPSRICVGCREPKEKRSMVRIVKTAENEICLDEMERRTDGALIFAETGNVFGVPYSQKGWSAP